MNEVDIITKDKDIISSRRPDRLMISEKKEAVIVDYKFASSKNSLELYSLQINEYKSLLEEIGFKISNPTFGLLVLKRMNLLLN